ncbi:Alternative oxidase, mitochondrial [Geodia barretti]|uniref:Alternative oxidase, mitochondrial n=1 Tax=Geodia barretti TaxID=519541 RepID=A0AA35S188_GEOBA|nr:Alternative oxidase, mitochondrial [Geodia barretti]
MLRTGFDLLSGYSWGKRFGTLDEKMWLSRIIYLETVAGVPGMIGAMVRHLKSLRRMTRDHGWIHTLLEEAENERMHLLTAMELRRPGPLFKIAVIGTQGLFVSMFWIAYFLSPRFCHKFVGYLEEEAVKTYTHCIEVHTPFYMTLD